MDLNFCKQSIFDSHLQIPPPKKNNNKQNKQKNNNSFSSFCHARWYPLIDMYICEQGIFNPHLQSLFKAPSFTLFLRRCLSVSFSDTDATLWDLSFREGTDWQSKHLCVASGFCCEIYYLLKSLRHSLPAQSHWEHISNRLAKRQRKKKTRRRRQQWPIFTRQRQKIAPFNFLCYLLSD